jgi:hypothetical protein
MIQKLVLADLVIILLFTRTKITFPEIDTIANRFNCVGTEQVPLILLQLRGAATALSRKFLHHVTTERRFNNFL